MAFLVKALPAFVTIVYFGFFLSTYAADLTSTSFVIKDPVIGTAGQYGSSAGFQLFSSGNTLLSGTGSSATYVGRYGFLYFPNPDLPQSITFTLSDNTVSLGTLSPSGPRYATTGGGSASNSVAHTMSASSNASSGYALSYYAATALASGGDIINGTTITSDIDGTQGVAQFGLSLSTDGAATIESAYRQSDSNWSFATSTVTTIATTAGQTSAETFSNRYLANISPQTPAGAYTTSITYIITGNF